MKTSVDLTIDRIFVNTSLRTDWSIVSASSLGKSSFQNKPWILPSEYFDQSSALIFTGNRKERELAHTIQMDVLAMEGQQIPFCYRCGRIIVPWQRDGELCQICSGELENESSVPWRRPEMQPRAATETNDQLVLEMNYRDV